MKTFITNFKRKLTTLKKGFPEITISLLKLHSILAGIRFLKKIKYSIKSQKCFPL